jgi:BirA family biotin operon repressor/biotin-[acetyl-CoA-carboxylase] ligase
MAVSTPLGVAPPGAATPGVDHRSLIALLADGGLHSGEDLAQALGVSRAAIWKAVERLRLRGIEIDAVSRRGYRLPQSVELLEEAALRAPLGAGAAARLRSLDLEFDVDSTNSRLLAAAPPPFGRADVLTCELQHAGRGRRGRHWIAPFGGSLALSMAWTFQDAAQASPCLSLCVGVAVARALARAGARGIGLKWPNDVWFADRKVGGVLIDLRAEAGGPAHVVIGIGLNVHLPPAVRRRIEASGVLPAAVADACAAPPSRNFLAGAIIEALLVMLVQFERDGFAAFRDAWGELDVLRDRPARAQTADAEICGTARGVDAHGALRLERDGRCTEFVSGEVSLRLDGDAH